MKSSEKSRNTVNRINKVKKERIIVAVNHPDRPSEEVEQVLRQAIIREIQRKLN